MSVEITLYTKKATKTGLITLLKNAGFKKTRHFIDEMNTPTRLHFGWFSNENLASSCGVEATVYKCTKEQQKEHDCSEWILHTRTRSSASYEDKQMQNWIIKRIRQTYGGTFYNDWYGTNRYTNLRDYRKFTPLEKSISLITNNSVQKLSQMVDCLTGYRNETSESMSHADPLFKRIFSGHDPSIVLYNALIPFLVAVVEYFYSQCFVSYLRFDSSAKAALKDEKRKFDLQEVLQIIKNEISFEETLAEGYNFQNLDSINKAFKKYMAMDLYATLSQKKKAQNKFFRVSAKLHQLLEARHKFVHELDINLDLTKEDYLNHLMNVNNAINLTLEVFKKKKLKIEVEYFPLRK